MPESAGILPARRAIANQDGWQPIAVPANWHVAGLENREGVVWYRREFEFEFEEAPGPGHFLEFDGVDYSADVYLNETHVGHHDGYFAPFSCDVSAALVKGVNRLLVRVDSPRECSRTAWPYRKKLIKGIFNHHDCRPGGWHLEHGQDGNTGGIWAGVRLVRRPSPFLADLDMTVDLADPIRAVVTVKLALGGLGEHSGLIEGVPVRLACRNPQGAPVAEIETVCVVAPESPGCAFTFEIPDPQLWWTWEHGDPALYEVTVEVGAETTVRSLGLRTIRAFDSHWELNGKRIFLRGTNIIPAQWLSTYSPDLIATDVALMKAAGLNSVRVHAHVNRREFYDACDRTGLLVWQDFALQWSYDPSEAFAQEAVRQIGEMVRHLRRHPAVAVWCCHNEPVGQEHTLDPLLVAAVLAQDTSRIVRSHSDFTEHPYHGWYYGDRHEYAALPGKPLVTEFGAQALPAPETLATFLEPTDLWPPDWERWAYHNFQYEQTCWIAGVPVGTSIESFVQSSQAAQHDLLFDAVDHYRRARYAPMIGIFQFMFVDGWPSITWSVVDHLRRPKLGYRALQAVCSPVYLSVRLAATTVRSGAAIKAEVVLINDLHRDIPDAGVAFRLLAADGTPVASWDPRLCAVPADGQVDLTAAWAGALLAGPELVGDYLIEGICREGDTVLSTVRRPVRLARLPAGLEAYKAVDMTAALDPP